MTDNRILDEIKRLEAIMKDKDKSVTEIAKARIRKSALEWVISPTQHEFAKQVNVLFLDHWDYMSGIEMIEVTVVKGVLAGYSTMVTFESYI